MLRVQEPSETANCKPFFLKNLRKGLRKCSLLRKLSYVNLGFEQKKGIFSFRGANSQRTYTLMRELEVLGNGHLVLDFADWKEFFESEMTEQWAVRLNHRMEQE